MKLKALAPAICLAAIASHAHAAGFAIQEQSVKGLGSAFAGGAAIAEDAATVYFNPAGMTRLKGDQFQLGLNLIIPQAEFNNRGSTVQPLLGGAALSGSNGGDGGVTAGVPNLYLVHSFSEDIKFGLGINAPFGLITEYDAGWVGRYHALRSDLKTININPAFALRFSSHWSAGFGLNFQYARANLTNAVDFSAACLSTFGAAACAANPGGPLVTPGSTATDGNAKLSGQSWTMGFNAGLLYEYDEDTRIGLSYRGRINHDVTGTVTLDAPAAWATIPVIGFTNSVTANASAELNLPDFAQVSVYHRMQPNWGVMADLTWTHWSRFDRLTPVAPTLPLPIAPTLESWENTYRVSIGTDYNWNDQLTLRGGFAYDQTPIPDAQHRTPRIPDEDRYWLSVGGSYAVNGWLSLDAAYAHIFVNDASIDYRSGPHAGDSSILVGKYDNSVDIVSVQANFKF